MSFNDIIKDSVLNGFTGDSGFGFGKIALILAAGIVIGAYIYFFYRFSAKRAFYSKDFNVSLAGLPLVVAAIMIAMQANLVVSLGMVGALSIVRYRTAVKSPMDLLYLFWAISGGIIVGVGLYTLAIVLCVCMTLVIFGASALSLGKPPLLVVIRMNIDADSKSVEETLHKYCKRVKKSSTIIKNREREMIFEVITNKSDELADEFAKLPGVISVNLLEYSGELRG